MSPRLFARFLTLGLILPAGLLATGNDPDVKEFGLGKQQNYTQTSAATPTSATNYSFNTFVDKRTGGTINGARLSGGGIDGFVSLNVHNDGAQLSTTYTSLSALNAARPHNQSYTLKIDTSGANSLTGEEPMADYSVTLGLYDEGGYFPSVVPTIQTNNGTWGADKLSLVPGLATNFGWSWDGYNTESSVILFSIEPVAGGAAVVDQRFQGTFTGGYTVAAGTLTPGVEYKASLIFANVVEQDTSSITGAQGVAYFANETSFTLFAVPEPSTYALLALGLGLVLLPGLRRRLAARR